MENNALLIPLALVGASAATFLFSICVIALVLASSRSPSSSETPPQAKDSPTGGCLAEGGDKLPARLWAPPCGQQCTQDQGRGVFCVGECKEQSWHLGPDTIDRPCNGHDFVHAAPPVPSPSSIASVSELRQSSLRGADHPDFSLNLVQASLGQNTDVSLDLQVPPAAEQFRTTAHITSALDQSGLCDQKHDSLQPVELTLVPPAAGANGDLAAPQRNPSEHVERSRAFVAPPTSTTSAFAAPSSEFPRPAELPEQVPRALLSPARALPRGPRPHFSAEIALVPRVPTLTLSRTSRAAISQASIQTPQNKIPSRLLAPPSCSIRCQDMTWTNSGPEASPPSCPICCQHMTWTDLEPGAYAWNGWTCDNNNICGRRSAHGTRWMCERCQTDFCSHACYLSNMSPESTRMPSSPEFPSPLSNPSVMSVQGMQSSDAIPIHLVEEPRNVSPSSLYFMHEALDLCHELWCDPDVPVIFDSEPTIDYITAAREVADCCREWCGSSGSCGNRLDQADQRALSGPQKHAAAAYSTFERTHPVYFSHSFPRNFSFFEVASRTAGPCRSASPLFTPAKAWHSREAGWVRPL